MAYEATGLHLYAQQIAQPELSDVVADILVVLEISIWMDLLLIRLLRDVGLSLGQSESARRGCETHHLYTFQVLVDLSSIDPTLGHGVAAS